MKSPVNSRLWRGKGVGFVDSSLCSAQLALWNGAISAELLFPYLERMDNAGFAAVDVMSPELASCIVRRNENPLQVLRLAGARLHNTPANVWISARCLLGSEPMTQDLLELGIATLAKCGARRITCFDAFNDVAAIERIMATCRVTNIEIAAALVYLSSPFHDHRYYAERAGYLARRGIKTIVLVDLAGSITPVITRNLVSAVRDTTGPVPIEFKTHCRSGVAEMSCFEALSNGADVLHTATETLSGGWSLPSAGYFAEHFLRWQTPVRIDPEIITEMDGYFLALAEAHDLPRGHQELPDPSAERFQIPVVVLARSTAAAEACGVSFDTLLQECRLVQQELGWPTLAHPVGPIVLEQAILNISKAERYAKVSPRLTAYLQGEHGLPPAAVNAELRARAAETHAQTARREAAVGDPEQRLLSHWFPDRDVTHLKCVPDPVQGATPEQYLKEQLEKFPTVRSIRVRKGEFLFDLKRSAK
jgi:pyruvate/oxaloacetate carboxyltransferase